MSDHTPGDAIMPGATRDEGMSVGPRTFQFPDIPRQGLNIPGQPGATMDLISPRHQAIPLEHLVLKTDHKP